jgi:putative endonuclease
MPAFAAVVEARYEHHSESSFSSLGWLAVSERLYSTYIVASQSRTLYIGVTGDLRRRVFQHKFKEFDGFSCENNCDRLVWFERYQEVGLAIAREKQLKAGDERRRFH